MLQLWYKNAFSKWLSTFLINDRPVFSNESRSLPINPPDCTILESRIFDNFILVDELFRKALRSFETCVLFSNNLCEKSELL